MTVWINIGGREVGWGRHKENNEVVGFVLLVTVPLNMILLNKPSAIQAFPLLQHSSYCFIVTVSLLQKSAYV